MTAASAAPRSLIVTLYGAYSRGSGGWLSVALLVRLLSDLGVDQASVRSSVARLKRRGLLVPERRSSAVGYTLSPQGREILAAGDRRIFTSTPARLADGWVLVVFSLPESERRRRHLLRSRLIASGFGTVSPGTWVAPARLAEQARRVVADLDVASYAEIFMAEHLAFGDLRERAARWWDLDALAQGYGAYVDQWAPVLARWRRRRSVDPVRAFGDYVGTLTDWRRLPYLDPGLPPELLPARWQGTRGAAVFAGLQAHLGQPAQRHVAAAQADEG